MAKNSEDKTLADYVAIAISPALIMALVGSLVFFLVAVLYRGEFVGRLHWILFFFVFGAVLIARISMQGDIADRAGLYGLVLGGLVWLALLMYVDWSGSGSLAPFGWAIDGALIAVTWWCAHRLTWDCTLIDEDVDASGEGLLQVAGLEGKPGPAAGGGDAPAEQSRETRSEKLPGVIGWWERYRRYKEEQKHKPHAPGVWVVYFSLAALPLFGLGQLLMSAETASSGEQAGRRVYIFWLMTIYVGSGLGLLLTTSFLGLRRYLRQRKLHMPATMTGVWLLVGGSLVAALLLVGALLPRPHPEFHFLEWTGLGQSSEREASDLDVKGGTAGKDKGRETGQKPKDSGKDGKAADKGEGGRDQGERGDKDGGGGKDENGAKAGKDSGGQAGKGKDDSRKNGGARKDKDGGGKQNEGRKAQEEKGGPKGPPEDRDGQEQRGGGGERKPQSERGSEAAPPDSPSQSLREFMSRISNVLKWIVAGIAALLLVFFLLRSGLKFLANFTYWPRRLLAALRSLWEGLWNWWGGKGSAAEEEEAAEEAVKPRPFAAFRDPFLAGEAEGMTHGQLVRYTFEALQAWAWERGMARQSGETPLEFVARIGEEIPALEGGARRLANFYVQIAYARGSLTRACREPLRHFWRLMVDAVERPMSAGVGSE
jgi:hypothetical protein